MLTCDYVSNKFNMSSNGSFFCPVSFQCLQHHFRNVDKVGNFGRKGKKVEKPQIDVNYPNPKPNNVPPKRKFNVKSE